MGNKPSMSRSERLRREKVTRYSIRKYSFGAASVAVAALFMFLGNGAVSANELGKQDSTVIEKNLEDKAPQEGDKAVQADASVTEVTSKPEESAKPTPTLDKSQLESYIAEIEEKISAGKYANKTEESIALLNSELASAKSVLASATSQDELKAAYNKFVTVVSSKLQNKPVEKKETPVVDTTNGKETVGKKADNTEKKSDSNSIENTGSNDSRNGKALDRDNAFRTEAVTNKKPVGNIPFSNATAKDIYVYKGEETNIELSVTDDSGKIKDIRIGEGSRGIDAPGAAGSRINNQYGLTFSSQRNETDGIVATQDNPAKVTITGTVSVPNKPTYTGKLVTRYLVAEDLDGAVFSEPSGNQETANPLPEGYFKLWVREQTQKYDIQVQTNEAGKIAVADVNNLSQADFEKIKNNIKITYNTADDARLLDKNGKLVENASNYIDTVTKQGDQIVVTYKDGSRDSVALTSVLRNNPLPTVKVPYSNQAEKQVYVYTGENTDLTFTANDDTAVKDMYLRGPGDVYWNNTEAFGFTTGKIDNGVVTGAGTISDNKQEATIKMTGVTTLTAPNRWTSYVAANDNDNFSSMPAGRNFNALDIDPDAKSKPGYIQFIVKDQTSKYDITAPTEKVAVADPDNVTEADLAKIKEKLKLEYSNNNDDANLADKKGKNVDDKDSKIQSVTKDDQGNLVVTYKDGSTDKRKLSEFVRKNPAPTVELPYSNLAEKQIYVYTGENTDLTFKASDDTEVKDLYLRGPGDVHWNNTTGFGFSMGVVNNGAVTGGGTISDNKQEATIKMTGVTTLTAPNRWTSFVVANDNDNFSSMPAGRDFNALDKDPDAKSKPGYIQFIVKDQTSKYDITAPTEKVAVVDPSNVTEADLAKIKEKLKLEYSNNNDDANLADKKGKNVDDKDSKIQSVTKDDQGNLVVTYKDGSTDKRKLSEFVSLDKQPAITAVNRAAEDKIAEINKTPNATDEEKAAAIAKVNADKEKAVAAINDANVTTKDAIDKAKNAGTTAIAGDNPVVAKKAAAKADVEAARQAKADAINADKNLTQAEKDAALAKVNKAAEDATKAIDAATTDAAVDTAKGTGVTEIGKVNPVAKENAKEAIGNALTAKNKEIDDRNDLTQAEKDAAKAEAKKLADAELTKVNAQPDNAETAGAAAAAQKLVNDAEDKGVADVTSVYPIAKEQAKKAVADELAKKEKELDARKDLTTEEKEAAKKEAKDLAKKATDAINAQPAIADTSDKATAAQTAVDTAKTKGVAEVKAVNPEAKVKPEAKKAIDDAATAKKQAIDARTDLSDKAKEALKDEVDEMATEAKKAIDDENVTATQDVKDIKEVAKTAVKGVGEANIPANKVAVKDPSALTADEKAKVLDAVKKVNPNATSVTQDEDGNVTVTTQNGDKVIITPDQVVKKDDLITVPKAGNNVVKPADKTLVKNPASLTPEEKAAIAAKVKEVNPDAVVTVDDKGNTTVSTKDGKTEVIPGEDLTKTETEAAQPKAGNDVVKPASKTVVANPEALTPEEKKAIEDKVKAVNPGSTVVVDDKGNATVTTPSGKTAVIPAADLTKTAEAASKPNAGDDVVKPASKTVVANPEALTPEEKKAIEDKVKAVNPGSTVVVDDKGNATVTTPSGKTAVIPAADLTKTAEAASKPNAGDDVVKPASKTVVANPEALTPEEKKAIEDKVKAVNPGATVVVDDKGNATVTTPSGKTAVIPASALTKTAEAASKPDAGDDVITPASKTVVANPEALTPEEKKAIEDKVKAVNPGSTVVVDDKGNATVTTPSGKTAVIPAADLTKTAEAVAQPNAGNDINTPAIKTAVANKDALTDAEKEAVKKAVSAVNPGATVVVDDKGNATVTTKDGKTAVIPAKDLVIPTEKLTDLSEQSGVNIPAVRTLVVDKNNLTPEEIAKIKAAVEAVNPGAIVVVDDKGNATVTTPSGKTATIAAENLVKDSEDATGVNGGNNLNMNFAKTLVADLDNLTDADKANAKARIISANANLDILDIVFDDKGNATVILKDGKVFTILSKDIFELRQSASYHGGNSSGSGNGTSGNNRANNTDVKVDKAKLEGAIRQLDELIIQESAKLDAETVKEANALLAAAKEVFANANATQAEVDAMVKRIEDFMLKVSMATNHTTPANNQATQAANTNQETSKAIKVAKELPNTGTEENASLAALGLLGVLSGFGLVARKKKED